MSEKIFVAYLTSGLGNRLRPLAAALAYCKLTGRQLRIYWDSITPNGCLTPLERLFENNFQLISLDEIEALAGRSISLFTEKGPGHGVQREAERFGRTQLLTLASQSPPRNCSTLQLDEPNEVVIIYDNDYLTCVPRELSIAALRSLNPHVDIRAKVLSQAAQLGLTLQTKGVHARGTDFGIENALAMYSGLIRERVGTEKFFLSTEDEKLEHGLHELFPNQLLSRSDRLHLQLNDGKTAWGDADSYTVTLNHGIDALTDIYLLSNVTLVVYHPASTFAEISRHLHGVLNTPAEPTWNLETAKTEFISRAKQLVPRGDTIFPLEIETGVFGPKIPEVLLPAFFYWETLGYQIPLMERLFMGSNPTSHLAWDANLFSTLASRHYSIFPIAEFRQLCPYPEAFSQLSALRGYIAGRKILIIGSESYWLELICAIAEASEITTVEYREIKWSGVLDCKTRIQTITWESYINELPQHQSRYDLILTYSSIEHSGLGRYGDRITPLGDLFTFLLMSKSMKQSGMCCVAVPTGQDLTHFNAHRIYGEKRIRALEHASNLKYLGIVYPDSDYLATDPTEHLREGWSLENLAKLPLGTYRQPILCFGAPNFTIARYIEEN